MKEFTFELSTKIYFGTGITADAIEKEKSLFKKNVMIVTTGGALLRLGYVKKLENMIKKCSGECRIIVFDSISQNPKLDEVRQAVDIGKSEKVGIVVGFGGGSAIDAAKAAAVGIASDINIEEYLLNGREPEESTLPIVAIPTTAGTGSELSRGAIISSPEHHIKTGIRGRNILPKVAIVDAAYTWTVPEKVTMETGFDVLAHAIESFVAVKANRFSEMLSEHAIRIVGDNLLRLKEEPENYSARENMCFASMLMGMNLAGTGTCLPHRMQYAIGAATDTSHAAGLIALYPAWIRYEFKACHVKMKQALEWLGLTGIETDNQAGDRFEEYIMALGVRYKLQDFGICATQLGDLSGSVTGNLANDILAYDKDIIDRIFEESM